MLLTEKKCRKKGKSPKKWKVLSRIKAKKPDMNGNLETIISPERLVIHKGLLSGLK